jgi:hypothetical protein
VLLYFLALAILFQIVRLIHFTLVQIIVLIQGWYLCIVVRTILTSDEFSTDRILVDVALSLRTHKFGVSFGSWF